MSEHSLAAFTDSGRTCGPKFDTIGHDNSSWSESCYIHSLNMEKCVVDRDTLSMKPQSISKYLDTPICATAHIRLTVGSIWSVFRQWEETFVRTIRKPTWISRHHAKLHTDGNQSSGSNPRPWSMETTTSPAVPPFQ